PDVTRDSNFPRAKLADDIGVRAGFAFPILVGNEVVGVMEFFSEEVLQPNSRLLEIFANIGTQMGRVMERQRAEKDLKEINDHLEFRVRERTAKLENSNRRLIKEISDRKMAEEKLKTYAVELERSNQDLQDFASVASHDLQEPLRKIISFGDRLKSQIQSADPKAVDYLNRMQRSADRMVHFIRDLLQFSRLMTQAQPIETTDLKQVITEVLVDLETRIIHTRGTVKVEDLPTLEADPFQMRQLFQNLLGNALKYHKEKVPPLVRLHSRPAGKQMWEITVEDNGIGFDEKYVKRIFKPFERLHNNGTFEGTGMGLAICQKIVNRHHGEIIVRSQPNKGSSFIVLLPNK
ncbi:MAG: ATP-binding protein, partial [Nitrospinaceae bacterium]